MLIIGSTCVLGYLLNKNGKTNRKVDKSVIISPNNIPSGPLIYDSNRVKQVDEYVRDLAARKHSNKIKQLYPLDYNQPIQIFPDDHLDGEQAKISYLGDFTYDDSTQKNFKNNQAASMVINKNVPAYDPESGNAFIQTGASFKDNINNTPMFRSPLFSNASETSGLDGSNGPASFSTAGISSQTSPLTGLPLDMTHANMQPMFGGMVRQQGVDNENPLVRLELFTGQPSTIDQGTYRQKREIVNPMPNNPDNLQRANINQVGDIYARAQSGVKPSKEYVTPVKSFRDAPMDSSSLRILPLNIDATRGVGKEQITYSGQMIQGQMGSTRGMLPNIRDNKFSLLTETNTKDYVPSKGKITASPQVMIPQVRDTLATNVYKNEYTAPPTAGFKRTDIGNMSEMYKNQLESNVSRRLEPYEPGFGAAQGRLKGPNTGVIIMNDPEKGFETEYIGLPSQGNVGTRKRNVEAPGYTLSDTLTDKSSGPLNNSGMKNNTAWKKTNLDIVPTNKSMNEKNTHINQPHKNYGGGYKKVKFENFVTNKETNEFSQSGNPKNHIPAHMSYDALFQDDVDNTVEIEHYGPATSNIKGKMSDGGEIDVDMEKLMVKDYLNNPTGISQGVDRNNFEKGLTHDQTVKVEFGGYYHNGKMGNGEDGKRKGKMRMKKDGTVKGRMNVPLKRDNPNDGLAIEVNFKDDKEEYSRRVINKTQPSQVLTNRMPVLIKTRNVESLNPRLNTHTRITNDLYPWIKKENETEETETEIV